MSEPTLEQLKQQVASLTLENATQRNTINFQMMEMLAVARATQMPVPASNQTTSAKWKMESLAEWVALYVGTLVKQRDQFYEQLLDKQDGSVPK